MATRAPSDDARSMAHARFVLALSFTTTIAMGGCATESSESTPSPGPCEAKDCESCLQLDSELCIWCPGSGMCQSYPAACDGRGIGYFTPGPLYPEVTADQAEQLCALDCAPASALLADTGGTRLQAGPCCSSALAVDSPNGPICPPADTGQGCVEDATCRFPETCVDNRCAGQPAVAQTECRFLDDQSCTCSTIEAVDPVEVPECSRSTVDNSVCCADVGWNPAGTNSRGACTCWHMICTTADPDCFCSAQYADYEPSAPSCSGALCCSNPEGPACGCRAQVDPGQTCESLYGPGFLPVQSCAVGQIGCGPTKTLVDACTAQ